MPAALRSPAASAKARSTAARLRKYSLSLERINAPKAGEARRDTASLQEPGNEPRRPISIKLRDSRNNLGEGAPDKSLKSGPAKAPRGWAAFRRIWRPTGELKSACANNSTLGRAFLVRELFFPSVSPRDECRSRRFPPTKLMTAMGGKRTFRRR